MECSIVATASVLIEKYFAQLPDNLACLHRRLSKCYSGSQQGGDEDTASSQSQSEAQQELRGISKVFSRGENNVPGDEDCPLLCFLANILP